MAGVWMAGLLTPVDEGIKSRRSRDTLSNKCRYGDRDRENCWLDGRYARLEMDSDRKINLQTSAENNLNTPRKIIEPDEEYFEFTNLLETDTTKPRFYELRRYAINYYYLLYGSPKEEYFDEEYLFYDVVDQIMERLLIPHNSKRDVLKVSNILELL